MSAAPRFFKCAIWSMLRATLPKFNLACRERMLVAGLDAALVRRGDPADLEGESPCLRRCRPSAQVVCSWRSPCRLVRRSPRPQTPTGTSSLAFITRGRFTRPMGGPGLRQSCHPVRSTASFAKFRRTRSGCRVTPSCRASASLANPAICQLAPVRTNIATSSKARRQRPLVRVENGGHRFFEGDQALTRRQDPDPISFIGSGSG
jgi:hypothetical protein